MRINSKIVGLFLGPIVFLLIFFMDTPKGMSDAAQAVLASTLWIAIWWITEAIPIAVTALLPLVLFPLSGGLDLFSTSASFGHKYIFLYIGGFVIALAIEKCNLHKRIALNIINIMGANLNRIILGFMVSTAFLSMWISNTATSVMMLPIGIAIVKQLADSPNINENENLKFGKALMLSIAYSASIGGIATLIGTPPNLVLAGVVLDIYDYEITFLQWITFGFPIAALLLFICWKYLTRYAYTFSEIEVSGGKHEIKNLLKGLGKITYEEKMVAVIFTFTAFCWITKSFLLQRVLPRLDDTIIAVIFAILLFMIPTQNGKERLMHWEDAVKMLWGIILLFGGGKALAKGFDSSGLAQWIGSQLDFFSSLPFLLMIFILVAIVNFLTEITSNMATTAMLLPVLAPIALNIDVHPFILMVGAAVASSCAFMLPVATPPNAVVFGPGYLKIPDMVGKGLFMNIISILILTIFVYFVLPELWDLIIHGFPKEFKS